MGYEGSVITSQITSQATSPIFCDVIEHVADRLGVAS